MADLKTRHCMPEDGDMQAWRPRVGLLKKMTHLQVRTGSDEGSLTVQLLPGVTSFKKDRRQRSQTEVWMRKTGDWSQQIEKKHGTQPVFDSDRRIMRNE
jgi:hypothetical protein